MKRNVHPGSVYRSIFFFLLVLLLLGLGLLYGLTPHSQAEAPASLSPAQAIQRAWRQAEAIGVYDFSSDIIQTTHLAPAITNVGRSSRHDELYLQGSLDRRARSMQLTLWQNDGSAATGRDGVEIRIEDGEAWGRRSGGSWQKIEDFSSVFAPAGDPLAFLTAVKNVKEISDVGEDAPSAITRFSTGHFFRR